MKILKGFAFTILGLILFIALSVFGLAFTVNSTALSPAFLTKEINQLPVSAIFQEITGTQGSQRLSEDIKSILNKTISDIEPDLKQQTGAALTQIYDYLLGKKSSPQLTLTLRDTILSDNFINPVIDNIPLAKIASDAIVSELNNSDIPSEYRPLLNYVGPAFSSAEPDIKAQFKSITPQIIDYLSGNATTLNAVLNIQPVIDSLKAQARTLMTKSLPVDIAGLPKDQQSAYINQYINQNYAKILNSIPAVITIDQSLISTDAVSIIQNGVSEAEKTLVEARHYIAMFQQYYLWLILLMIILAGCIIAIHHSVKGAARSLGAIFLPYGFIIFGLTLFFRYYIAPEYLFPNLSLELPVVVANYLHQLIFDVITPLQNLGLGFLLAGITLLVVSFVYRGPETTKSDVCV